MRGYKIARHFGGFSSKFACDVFHLGDNPPRRRRDERARVIRIPPVRRTSPASSLWRA